MENDKSINKIECLECNYIFELDNNSMHEKCPKCGSNMKSVSLEITETITARESIKIEGKDKRYNSKKNPRFTLFDGYDFSISRNEYVKKKRIIDKDKDYYLEVITDEDGNNIRPPCEEKLTEHFGHGSAKYKNDKS